jgi:hypothetical protein
MACLVPPICNPFAGCPIIAPFYDPVLDFGTGRSRIKGNKGESGDALSVLDTDMRLSGFNKPPTSLSTVVPMWTVESLCPYAVLAVEPFQLPNQALVRHDGLQPYPGIVWFLQKLQRYMVEL